MTGMNVLGFVFYGEKLNERGYYYSHRYYNKYYKGYYHKYDARKYDARRESAQTMDDPSDDVNSTTNNQEKG